MSRYAGYLFAKLGAMCTKSEGPEYFLQQPDRSEIYVVKKTQPWRPDPNLHKFLNEKVFIEGRLSGNRLLYKNVGPYEKRRAVAEPRAEEGPLKLELELGFGDVLQVNKFPGPGEPEPQAMDLTLKVSSPDVALWFGTCPTSQKYDFALERGDEVLIRWSDGMMFSQVVTPVLIQRDDPSVFNVTWEFSPADIPEEGRYLIRATFIASHQHVTKSFEIKFVQ